MSYKTKRAKAKKRASTLADKAWEALEAHDPQMALKLARQAVKENQSNPLLWNDLGLLAQQNNELQEAERAFHDAIFLAPGYAEAYANAATLSAQRGRLHQAARLQEKAAALAPALLSFRERLREYHGMLPPEETPEEPTPAPLLPLPSLSALDWQQAAAQLQSAGVALLPKILNPEECAVLRQLYSQEGLFEKTINLSDEGHGQGEYKFLRRPLPELVARLRASVYERVAPIANHWRQLLQEQARYPETLQEFLRHCHQHGQRRTTPILLRYTEGGYNELHQDIWGKVYFPFQLAITLSERGPGGFTGGEFIVAEEGSRRKAKRAVVETDLGDGVLFCARHRLVKIGQLQALAGVRHGLAALTSGERYCLGVPFHDYFGA